MLVAEMPGILFRGALLLAVLIVPSPAAKGPFSHKYHRTQISGCEACHKVSSGNMTPEKDACVTCHDEVTINEHKRVVPKFNHEQHLKMGNIASLIAKAIDAGTYLSPAGNIRAQLDTKDPCGGCHRAVEESETVTAAIHPRMADCLVCHTRVEPVESCAKCHEPGFPLKPATHTATYLDDHASGKAKIDKTTCAVCHGRKFTCRGCH